MAMYIHIWGYKNKAELQKGHNMHSKAGLNKLKMVGCQHIDEELYKKLLCNIGCPNSDHACVDLVSCRYF